jgi:hypothetical protein
METVLEEKEDYVCIHKVMQYVNKTEQVGLEVTL